MSAIKYSLFQHFQHTDMRDIFHLAYSHSSQMLNHGPLSALVKIQYKMFCYWYTLTLKCELWEFGTLTH